MDLPALSRLNNHILEVPRSFLALSETDMRARPRPDKWSKIEILGHLIDSARYNLMRFTEISFLPKPYRVLKYHQADLVSAQKYQEASPDNLTLTWQLLNQQIYSLLRSYPAEAASWEVLLPDGEENDFFFLADDYVVHLEHHLKQLFGQPDKKTVTKQSFSIAEAKKLLSTVESPFVLLERDGNWEFEYYAPQGLDLQQPHARDEVYFITSGSGMFVNGDKRHAFGPGDLLFVQAGVVHRFEDFSEDFGCWVVFGGNKKIPDRQ